jgi:hypothetical protein
MDQLITVEEVSEHLKNPPSLDPRPDFLKIRALQKHIIKALKKLLCPQSQMHGWTGLVMDPALYVLLEPTAFIVPVSPGDVPTYPGFASPSIIKNIDNLFERDRNYYLSFVNINRACFTMLDDSVNDRYKVSNTPNLTGWNSSMTIREIIVQLTTNYGVPDAMVMFNNDKLFRSPFPATEPPEMLFHRLEQCQEVQTIGQDPYTETHIINVAVRILMQSGMFQPKEFETWAAVPLKTYQALKTFIHGAYTRRLTAITLRNTAGQLGYVANQNLFNMLSDDNPDDGSTDDTATTITHTAAAVTTGVSSLGQTYAPTAAPTNIPSEVATAIQQLSANQHAADGGDDIRLSPCSTDCLPCPPGTVDQRSGCRLPAESRRTTWRQSGWTGPWTQHSSTYPTRRPAGPGTTNPTDAWISTIRGADCSPWRISNGDDSTLPRIFQHHQILP